MAGITSAVLGVGTAIAGAVGSKKATKKANRANAAAAEQQRLAHEQTVFASEASIRAEALRERQMELEGIRRRRDIIRQTQSAEAQGIAAAISQGVSIGSSSVQAGRQQAASRERVDILSNLQNIMIGAGIFEENREITRRQTKAAEFTSGANINMSQAQTHMNQAGMFQNMMGFGLNLAQSGPQINSVFQSSFGGAGLFGNSTSKGAL